MIPKICSPLGLVLPHVSRATRLLSRIWFYEEEQKSLGWYDTLPRHPQKELYDWLRGLNTVSKIQVSQNILEGLTAALSGKFSHKRMPCDDLQVAFTSIEIMANSPGLGLPMESTRNIFEQSLSYALFRIRQNRALYSHSVNK